MHNYNILVTVCFPQTGRFSLPQPASPRGSVLDGLPTEPQMGNMTVRGEEAGNVERSNRLRERKIITGATKHERRVSRHLQAPKLKHDVSADVRSVSRDRQIHTQRRLLTLVVSTCGPHCRPIITLIIKCINWTQLLDRRPSGAVRLLHHMGLDSQLSRASLTEHMGSIWSQNVPTQHCNPAWGRHGHDGRVSETTSLSVCCGDLNYFRYLCLIQPFVSESLLTSSLRSGRSAFFGA